MGRPICREKYFTITDKSNKVDIITSIFCTHNSCRLNNPRKVPFSKYVRLLLIAILITRRVKRKRE